jgi:hypothetical protein
MVVLVGGVLVELGRSVAVVAEPLSWSCTKVLKMPVPELVD